MWDEGDAGTAWHFFDKAAKQPRTKALLPRVDSHFQWEKFNELKPKLQNVAELHRALQSTWNHQPDETIQICSKLPQ